ncbi:MAG: NADH-quinone oxidoreductase subunit [Blastocatellia bacterium]|jgi:NADH-quinone oxidoreductase subunit C|nr:NADH-quinone oxidoreductase subunit [Blastocatellia bacterium]
MPNETEPRADVTSDMTPELPAAPSPPVAALQRDHPDWIFQVINAFGETTIIVPREHIVAACTYLKTTPELEFNFLADLCGVDRGPEEEPRFEVNYHLFSVTRLHRVRLKVLLDDDEVNVPTVTGVWRTANWHERETFDLLGIVFTGHPDLRRILMPEDSEGHPLRKDFPLRGYEPYSLT